MKRTRPGVGVAVVVLGACGCASTMYTPRPDGRIAITTSGVVHQFTKNGTSVDATADNLQAVVADNPVAEAQAREAASDYHLGFALDIGGLVAMGVGAVVIAPRTNANGSTRPVSDDQLAGGGALLVGGLVSICAALWYLTAAQSRQLDAINIYNDGVRPWPPAGAPAAPPVMSPVPLGPPPSAAPAPLPPLPPPMVVPAPAAP